MDLLDQTSVAEKEFQLQYYTDIVKILLKNGYNRVNSKISEFDKIIGGLCWGITFVDVDVDVDILFQENLTTGERIKLSEIIVHVLRKMQCPVQIQAHQIQGGVGGSDYKAIFPVVAWLMKKHETHKEETHFHKRKLSTLQFSKVFTIKDELQPLQPSKYLSKIIDMNNPRRIMRRTSYFDSTKLLSEKLIVQSCLLEFGETVQQTGSEFWFSTTSLSSRVQKIKAGRHLTETSSFESKLAQVQKEAIYEFEALDALAQEEEKELLKVMQDAGTGDFVQDEIIIEGLQSVGMAASAYEARMSEIQKEIEQDLLNGKLGPCAAARRRRQYLEERKANLSIQMRSMQEQHHASISRQCVMQQAIQEAKDYHMQLERQLVKLMSLEAACVHQSELRELQRLLGLRDRLAGEEKQFGQAVEQRKVELIDVIQKLECTVDGLGDIEKVHANTCARYGKLRELIADASADVSGYARALDEIPTQSELLQYERRFTELYLQVSWKLDETRKYFDLYNSLDSTLKYLKKEVKLLDNIGESFDQSLRSAKHRDEFLSQFQTIVAGVEELLRRQQAQTAAKQTALNESKISYQQRLEARRKYVSAVQELKLECDKNEWLVAKLRELKVTLPQYAPE